MALTPTLDDSTTLVVDSALSEAPSSTLLNNIGRELGLETNPIEIDSELASGADQTTLRQPKKRAHKNFEYIEVLTKGEGKKARTSWYWQHGTEFERQTQDKTGSFPKYWVCDKCTSFTHYSVHGSQKINAHLKKVHRISEAQPAMLRESIHSQLQKHTPQATIDLGLSEIDQQRILERKFYTAFVAFLVCCHQAFHIVENPWFLAMLATLSNLVRLVPKSHTTARDWTVNSFHTNKARVKDILQTAQSKIHLSFDLWTSGNYYAFNAVVAHFVSHDFRVKTALIGFREIIGSHSGENIAESVRAVCEEFDIINKLGCFVLDNAGNNDTCIKTLARTWSWKDSDVPRRRLRCIGHIINLVAQAFVLGEKQTEFEEVLHAEQNDLELEGRQKLWNICGPIGKLHYIVVYILRTPQRRAAFKRGGEDCDPTTFVPKRDNSTRWNSIFQMILRALQLQQQLDFYVFNNLKDTADYERLRKAGRKEGFIEEMKLTVDDWYILRELAVALKIFEDATKALEGRASDLEFGSMAECIPVIESLQSSLIYLQHQFPEADRFPRTSLDDHDIDLVEDAPVPGSNPATAFMTNCTNNAFTKLSKYYLLTDASVWYTAGLIFNPAVKWEYLKYQWDDKPGWLSKAQAQVQKLWDLEYKPTGVINQQKRKQPLPERGSQSAKSIRREANYRDSTLFSFKTARSNNTPTRDEYEEYLAEAVLEFEEGHLTISALQYWQSQSQRWPHLTRLALDALSIPAMSSECERCFSSCKNTITDLRNRLEPDSVEACECQRHWFMNSVIS
jgi:hypothetical protein